MSNEPRADVREMYMAHTMFRREFGLLPALIGGVGAADVARARIIEQHFELIQMVLHHHHQAEDVYLWPRLLARAARDAEPVVAAMEAQHGELGKLLHDLTVGLRDWQETADPVRMPLLFGLLAYEGDPEVTQEVIEHMPPEIGTAMAILSSEAFAQYAKRVHGTPTPAKSGELHG